MSSIETSTTEIVDSSGTCHPFTPDVKIEAVPRSPSTQRSLRLKLLLILMMALTLVTFQLLPSDPVIAKRMEMLLHPTKTPTADIDPGLLRVDPPLYTLLPLDAVGVKYAHKRQNRE